MAEDYYSLLGASKSASADELKKAYRKMALQYHPDRNQGNKEAEEHFKQVNEAYETLGDPQKKKMYDQLGHDGYKGSGAGNPGGSGAGYARGGGFEDIFGGFEDIFDSFFGGAGNRSRSGSAGGKRQARGDNLLVKLTITLKEAFKGIQKVIVINRDEECVTCNGLGTEKEGDVTTCPQCNGRGEVIIRQGFFSIRQTCSQCEGTGVIVRNPCKTCGGRGIKNQKRELTVNIPAGVETGNRLTLQGEGSAIKRGARGSLYIDIEVQAEPGVKRDGKDLLFTKEVPFTTMVLGGEISILNLDDKEVSIKIPAATPNSQMFKVKGQGMPVVSAPGRRGDMYVTVLTSIPKKISHNAKTLLLQLEKELLD